MKPDSHTHPEFDVGYRAAEARIAWQNYMIALLVWVVGVVVLVLTPGWVDGSVYAGAVMVGVGASGPFWMQVARASR